MGTSFDPKEEIFRNYGGLFGPFSDLSLAHSWGAGQQFTTTVVWVDPSDVIAAADNFPVKETEHTELHTPNLNKPLRPGMWKVKLLYLWEVSALTQ